MSRLCSFGLWLALAAGAGSAAVPDLPPGTAASPYLLDDLGDMAQHPLGTPLLSATADFDYDSQLYGVYGGLEEYDEYYLYLFPGGKLAIKDDCRCATPSYVLATGSWTRHAGVLSLTLERKAPGTDCSRDALAGLERRFGSLARVDVMATARNGKTERLVLVPEDTLMQAAMDRLFVRQEGFKDWKQEQAKLMRQFGSAPKGCDCGAAVPKKDAAKTKP